MLSTNNELSSIRIQSTESTMSASPEYCRLAPMRIGLIGPAYPYRGGIAHHSNLLAQHLRKRGHQVDMITFSRQYPQLLYPGKSQIEPEESLMFSKEIIAEKMIDAVNPLNWICCGRELR